MYDLINHHIEIVLRSIPQADIARYDWLIQNVQDIGTANTKFDIEIIGA